MARAIASTYLTFGLVSVPVKVYKASDDERISFNEVHKACRSRLQHRKFCPSDQVEVRADEVAKGFNTGTDKEPNIVLIEADDLSRLSLGDRKIEIVEFSAVETVDPRRLNGTHYFLGTPEKTPDDAYRLLFTAMREDNLIGLCEFSMRGRVRLAYVRADAELGVFVLELLYYDAEMRTSAEIPKPGNKPVDADQLALARRILKSMTSKRFDYSAYRDEYNERVMAMIQEKLAGKQKPLAPEPERPKADLLAALKASLAVTGKKGKEAKK